MEPETPRKGLVRGQKFEPTPAQRQLVMLSRAIGYTNEQICQIVALPLVISESTLKKHFREELETGHLRATAQVAATLYGVATNPGHLRVATAGIFWLKARANWKDNAGLTITPPGGAPADGDDESPIEITLSIGDKIPKG